MYLVCFLQIDKNKIVKPVMRRKREKMVVVVVVVLPITLGITGGSQILNDDNL
jgi:hypothetical protein